MKKIILLIASLLLVSGCATKQDLLEKLQGSDVAHFKQKTTITTDQFEPTIRIDTQKGFVADNGTMGSLLKGIGTGAASYSKKSMTSFVDYFVIAFIDKKTRHIKFHVYSYIKYIDNTWRYYRHVNYGSPIVTAKVDNLESDVNCSGKGYCEYIEQFTFPVTENELRKAVANFTYNQSKIEFWAFKLKPNSTGESIVGKIVLQEIVALLEEVDKHIVEM
jgi:hypothetical protein